MKKIQYDPILTEMHEIKNAISAECNHDVDTLFDRLRELGCDVNSVESKATPRTKRRVKRIIHKGGPKRRKVGVKIGSVATRT